MEPHELSALEQGRLIRTREISPRELVLHHLERVERLDHGSRPLGAFVTLTAERALDRAAAMGSRVPDDPAPL
ncbi:hypothetical protein GCM10022215_06270 [Nocardioides fonticola]|uniref:Amidase n=1 Tax=Nocardioides fonticola TaxID=450363 RepID=A0ABP7XCI1_9ACTN